MDLNMILGALCIYGFFSLFFTAHRFLNNKDKQKRSLSKTSSYSKYDQEFYLGSAEKASSTQKVVEAKEVKTKKIDNPFGFQSLNDYPEEIKSGNLFKF